MVQSLPAIEKGTEQLFLHCARCKILAPRTLIGPCPGPSSSVGKKNFFFGPACESIIARGAGVPAVCTVQKELLLKRELWLDYVRAFDKMRMILTYDCKIHVFNLHMI